MIDGYCDNDNHVVAGCLFKTKHLPFDAINWPG
jgi:hypothetical protein